MMPFTLRWPTLSIWQWIGVVLLGFLALSVAYAVVSSLWLRLWVWQARREMEAREKFKRVYFARLSFEVPESATVRMTAHIEDTDITYDVVEPPAGVSVEDARAAAVQKDWDEFLAKESEPHNPKEPSAFRILADEKIEPGGRLVIYHPRQDGEDHVSARLTLLRGPDHYFIINHKRLNPSVDNNPLSDGPYRTKETVEKVRDHMTSIYRRLKPASAGFWEDGKPKADSFFLVDYALINTPWTFQESAGGGPVNHPYVGDISLEVAAPTDQHIPRLATVAAQTAMRAAALALRVKMQVLRSGSRTVGGMDGDEWCIIGTDDEETVAGFRWRYGGTDAQSEVNFEAELSPTDVEKKLAAWDHVLDSVRLNSASGRR
jgi:hypothetical protein